MLATCEKCVSYLLEYPELCVSGTVTSSHLVWAMVFWTWRISWWVLAWRPEDAHVNPAFLCSYITKDTEMIGQKIHAFLEGWWWCYALGRFGDYQLNRGPAKTFGDNDASWYTMPVAWSKENCPPSNWPGRDMLVGPFQRRGLRSPHLGERANICTQVGIWRGEVHWGSAYKISLKFHLILYWISWGIKEIP